MQGSIRNLIRVSVYAIAVAVVFIVSWVISGGKSDSNYSVTKDPSPVAPTAEADVPYYALGGYGDDGCDDGDGDCGP